MVVAGSGLTRTVACTGMPGHPLATGVMVNVTNTGLAVLLINVPEILPVPLLPIVPVTAGLFLVQLKVVPVTAELNAIVVILAPEQMDCDAGVDTTSGVGFTSTDVDMELPGQPLAVGVTVKVTVTGFILLLISVPEIFPLPLLPIVPVTAGLSLVQLNVVDGTAPLNAIEVILLPEQTTWLTGDAFASGIGLTTRPASTEMVCGQTPPAPLITTL